MAKQVNSNIASIVNTNNSPQIIPIFTYYPTTNIKIYNFF